MKKYIWVILILLILALFGALFFYFYSNKQLSNSPKTSPTPAPAPTPTPEVKKEVYPPVSNAKARITKKPFGIYITPQTSPVQPEKFTGFHTGTDFEINADELNAEVPVSAICDGKILIKQVVSGYGGVIVQSGTISGQAVTILYGHLNLAQSAVNVGDQISGGRQIAILGDNQSYYTGGERKHLHLGVHKGESIDYRGYVNSSAELDGWMDIAPYL